MTENQLSLAPFYAGWDVYQQHLVAAIAPLTAEQLALSARATKLVRWHARNAYSRCTRRLVPLVDGSRPLQICSLASMGLRMGTACPFRRRTRYRA